MKPKDLREKNKTELEDLLKDKRDDLREVKQNINAGRVNNVKKARNIKKDIARILTILNEGSYEK